MNYAAALQLGSIKTHLRNHPVVYSRPKTWFTEQNWAPS
jgi:hypothetical protein